MLQCDCRTPPTACLLNTFCWRPQDAHVTEGKWAEVNVDAFIFGMVFKGDTISEIILGDATAVRTVRARQQCCETDVHVARYIADSHQPTPPLGLKNRLQIGDGRRCSSSSGNQLL